MMFLSSSNKSWNIYNINYSWRKDVIYSRPLRLFAHSVLTLHWENQTKFYALSTLNWIAQPKMLSARNWLHANAISMRIVWSYWHLMHAVSCTIHTYGKSDFDITFGWIFMEWNMILVMAKKWTHKSKYFQAVIEWINDFYSPHLWPNIEIYRYSYRATQ